MFTQCSKCETVFRLSAEVLRAAGGQVRCGRCGEVFNALARLAEDSTGFAGGESALDLEERADSILESVGVPQIAQTVAKEYEEFGPPGVEIAHLKILDWSEDGESSQEDMGAEAAEGEEGDEADEAGEADEGDDAGEVDAGAHRDAGADHPSPDVDRAMEFTLPPGELDRIFVETKKRAFKPLPTMLAPPASRPPPATESQEQEIVLPPPPPHPERRTSRYEAAEVSDDVRRDMLQGFEDAAQPALLRRQSEHTVNERLRFNVWLGAAIAAALLLMLQVANQNRDWPVVRALYGAIGPQAAPANFSAYQLRQWGVTGDPDANGTLRVRASILNTAAQLQPYPLLRVTLADRFGKRVGARDFEPSEYLGKPTAKLLAPGEQVDATLQILDPGKNAEGFEIDVCLRGAEKKIACANDVAPQGKR